MKLKLLIEKYNFVCERLAEIEMAAAMDGDNLNDYFDGEYYALLIEKEQIEDMEVDDDA